MYGGGWEDHGQNSALSWKGFESGSWSVSQVSVVLCVVGDGRTMGRIQLSLGKDLSLGVGV